MLIVDADQVEGRDGAIDGALAITGRGNVIAAGAAQPELRLLRTFACVAEELHFRRAARRLNATQSSVSLQVRELERRLGVTLLRRDRRGVALTPAGASALADARDLLARAERLVAKAREAESGRVGLVSVGVIGAATFEALPRLVEAARRTAPGLDFRFREMGSREQVAALRGGTIDVGLLRAEARASGLCFRTIHTEPIACLLPEGHRLARQDSVAVADLEHEPILNLARDQDPAGHDFYVGIYRAAGFEPRIVQEVSQAATVLFAIATLGCVALGPAGWGVMRRRGVALRPVLPPVPALATRLVWNPARVTPSLEALLEAARGLPD